MPHKNIKTTVRVFDVVFERAEYWRKWCGWSRSRFYEEALLFHVNNMGKWNPKGKVTEMEYINKRGKE